jgi:O-antigen/teichoic acid export membrane protein
VAMLIGAVGSAILVPRYGMIGAGIALLLSAIAIVAGGLWVMHRVLGTEL